MGCQLLMSGSHLNTHFLFPQLCQIAGSEGRTYPLAPPSAYISLFLFLLTTCTLSAAPSFLQEEGGRDPLLGAEGGSEHV